MKKLKIGCAICCLPIVALSVEVAVFDARLQVTGNSPNRKQSFALNPAAPLVSKELLEGYSGPAIYGAMNMEGRAYWRVAGQDESGMSVRLNESSGSRADGLFLMPVDSIRFDKKYNTFYAMDIFTSQIQRLESVFIRFVIQAGGTFYISEPSSNLSRSGRGHQKDIHTLNALQAQWFHYDPTVSAQAVSIIGPRASPEFTDIDFVGFTLFAKGAEVVEGVNVGVRSFSVEARK